MQSEFEEQYDIVQKIGEGWFSRVYLTEHRNTHHELVIKAINSKNMSVEEFLREFHHSMILGSHRNILTVFPDMVIIYFSVVDRTEYRIYSVLIGSVRFGIFGEKIHHG